MDPRLADLLGLDDAERARLEAGARPAEPEAAAPEADHVEEERRRRRRGWFAVPGRAEEEAALRRRIAAVRDEDVLRGLESTRMPDVLWRNFALEATLRGLVGGEAAPGL